MVTNLVTLLGGALLLSFLHGLIPNHWLPFVLLGRDRQWSPGRMVYVTFLGGTAHLASTVLVGVMIGIAGLALSTRYEAVMRWAAPVILVAAGLWIAVRKHGCHHGHLPGEPRPGEHAHGHEPGAACEPETEHIHTHEHVHEKTRGVAGDWAAVGTLCAVMFFSPCFELDTYYVIAYRHGWLGIGAVSAIYLVVTVGVMMALVGVSARGLGLMRWPFFERNENKISGATLILLGIGWLLFPL